MLSHEFFKKIIKQRLIIFLSLTVITLVFVSFFYYLESKKLQSYIFSLSKSVDAGKKELNDLKNQNQYKINEQLKKDIKTTHDIYGQTIKAYEKILDLKSQKQDVKDMEKTYAETVKFLSDLNYSSGAATLAKLNIETDKQYAKLAAGAAPAASGGQTQTATVNNTPPSSGYSFQAVKIDSGTFNVAIVAADLNSTRVIVDTASDSDCGNNCPVMSLGDYANRSGAYAGINGQFFCPAEYPSCAGKTNSFDTLLMNKNKHYFNSDNNKYSTVPLVYFTGNTMGLRGQSLEWGRDTGVDAVLANFPLYLSGGNIVFAGSGDAKLTNVGPRTFVANKGNFAYIGIVYAATSEQAAKILKALGFENALGLDQGGSTALWFNGYKAGPGRNIPSALLFVRK